MDMIREIIAQLEEQEDMLKDLLVGVLSSLTRLNMMLEERRLPQEPHRDQKIPKIVLAKKASPHDQANPVS